MSEVLENVVEMEQVELVDTSEVETGGVNLLTVAGVGILSVVATAGIIEGGKRLYKMAKNKFGKKNVVINETTEEVEGEFVDVSE